MDLTDALLHRYTTTVTGLLQAVSGASACPPPPSKIKYLSPPPRLETFFTFFFSPQLLGTLRTARRMSGTWNITLDRSHGGDPFPKNPL